mgnify:FL=1
MSLKSLVNDKSIWDSFVSELEIRLSAVHNQMEQAPNAESLYRLQGQAFTLRKLKQLREQVNA